jgi:hypothetical protein
MMASPTELCSSPSLWTVTAVVDARDLRGHCSYGRVTYRRRNARADGVSKR